MLGTVLSIDPGLRKCGCAIWTPDGTLLRAWTATSKGGTRGPTAWVNMVDSIKVTQDISVLVCEQMQVYRDKTTNADDLLELTGVLGALTWRFKGAKLQGYKPAEWKKQTPKRVVHARLKSRLSDGELKCVQPKATHDAWDAIGIGAFYFRKQGVERWQLRKPTKK
jgi:Holliday junction resolvasome RuvABC endonuclease subunit|tara:strand:- start:311 stop:808 length:498 start_codon:yes stop_codon:yes gene_type:complete